jgi:hypothetical protein
MSGDNAGAAQRILSRIPSQRSGPLVGTHGGSPLRRMTPDVHGRCLVWGKVSGKSRP